MEPTSRHYHSMRLHLHYLDWSNPEASPLILIHGGKDHAHSFDWVARALCRKFRVIAPDLRGHGDSEWAVGSMYSLVDSVLDLSRLVEHLQVEQVVLVGHSYGGAVAVLYAGIFPERVSKLVAIEGVGVPARLRRSAEPNRELAASVREWVEKTRAFEQLEPRSYESIDAAAAHLRAVNDFLGTEQAEHLARTGLRQNADGRFCWKFDPLSRVVSPFPFATEQLEAIKGRIACPTLLLHGEKSWAGDPLADGRAASIPNVQSVGFEGAGHWLHHERLEEFLAVLRRFLAET